MSHSNAALDKLSTPELLNLIGQLHEIGIRDEVPLPQIIVVGAQSSGKSSVLEAISQLSFPRGQQVTTTFATEIALRKSDTVSIKARIIPDRDAQAASLARQRPKEHIAGMLKWQRELANLDDFEALVVSAQECIQKHSSRGAKSFSFDKLRIEASGPAYPQLTLIDLPGLILMPNEGQTKQDVANAEKIVRSHMEYEQSIILAVMTAENELVTQAAMALAQEYDPKGKRTIGVITKPDRLEPNDPREFELISCTRDEIDRLKLTHGWYVLKNRSFNALSLTSEERDLEEKKFFQQTNWSGVPEHRQGIARLRSKLCLLQEKTIRQALPHIIQKIDSRLDQCQRDQQNLGNERSTDSEQRAYLEKVAVSFNRIVQNAVLGESLHDEFFWGGTAEEPRRLRSVIKQLYADFASDLYRNGRTWIIESDMESVERTKAEYPADQEVLTRDEFLEIIRQRNGDISGMESAGMVNQYPLLTRLFKEQVKKWESIAKRHVRIIFTTVSQHLSLVFEHLAGQDTAARLQGELIRKSMNIKENDLFAKVEELVAAYLYWNPVTLNPYYTQHVFDANSDLLRNLPKANDMMHSKAVEQYALILSHLSTHYNVSPIRSAGYITSLIQLRTDRVANFHGQCCSTSH
jgi:GTPase SAR1 family protein